MNTQQTTGIVAEENGTVRAMPPCPVCNERMEPFAGAYYCPVLHCRAFGRGYSAKDLGPVS